MNSFKYGGIGKNGCIKVWITNHLLFPNSGMKKDCMNFKIFGILIFNGNCQFVVLIQYATMYFGHFQKNVWNCRKDGMISYKDIKSNALAGL